MIQAGLGAITITEVASQRATSGACNAVDTCAVAFPNIVTVGQIEQHAGLQRRHAERG